MAMKKRQHGSAFKAKVALATLQERKTIQELSAQFSVHPTLIHGWKKRLLEGAAELFETPGKQKGHAAQKTQEVELFEQIGRLKMELEWLKKKAERVG